jgi:parallel beta-helix repeat protein
MGAAHLVAAAKFNHMMRITTHHVMFDGIDFDGNNFLAGLCGVDVEQSTNYHHIWVMNSQVHGFGQSGIQENGAEWFWNLHNHVYNNACTVRIAWQGSGISHVVPAVVPNYTPTAMDNYWAPFHIVSAYNVVHDNYGQQGLYAGKNTDGNGIIYDTFRSYAGPSLCLGNIVYHNGGKGIHVFKSGHVTVANNTAYNNNWDTCNPGTWRAEISAVDSVGSAFVNNIAWTTRGTGITSANAPFMAHSGLSNTWTNNIAYGAPNAFADSNAYPSPANKANVDPLLVDVAKNNFALQPGSPAIGFGTLQPYLPPQCIDVGACPSTCTTCP